MKMIDLNHVIEHGMVTYRGLPAPLICDFLSREQSRQKYAPGTEFHIGKIEMVANTGTYLDSPFHRYEDGHDVAELKLSQLSHLPCVVARVDTSASRAIEQLNLSKENVRGHAVLIQTAWSRHWRTDAYFEGHPFVTSHLATWLKESGAALVGIDSYNIDNTDTLERPAHSILLRHDIPIVEHLCNLESVPESGAQFFAIPPRIKGMGTFPVRAFAVIQ